MNHFFLSVFSVSICWHLSAQKCLVTMLIQQVVEPAAGVAEHVWPAAAATAAAAAAAGAASMHLYRTAAAAPAIIRTTSNHWHWHIPADTTHWPNVGLILGQRLRRWSKHWVNVPRFQGSLGLTCDFVCLVVDMIYYIYLKNFYSWAATACK